MSDNSNDGNQNCFVKAICNYHYPYKDEEIHIKKDEIFLLIRKTTEDWWQVCVSILFLIVLYLILLFFNLFIHVANIHCNFNYYCECPCKLFSK